MSPSSLGVIIPLEFATFLAVSDQSQQDVSLHPILFKSYVPYFAVSYSRAETMLIYLCVYTLE